PAPAPTASAEASEGPLTPTGEVTVIAEGLDAPWSVVRLDDAQVPGGAVLVSERDTGAVRELTDAGLRTVGTVPGVQPGGEGGLLGLAALALDGTTWLYAYLTAAS